MQKFTKLLSVATISSLVVACQVDLNPPQVSTTTSQSSARLAAEGDFVPNELLVKFKANISASKKAEILGSIKGTIKERILTELMERLGDKEGVMLVELPEKVLDVLSRLKVLENFIEYAEPNYIYKHNAISNDTYIANAAMWGMHGATTTPANQYGSHAAVAWGNNHTGSNTVYIGIIDEGYMYTHEDLAANAGVNPGEIAGNGIDDDGNGLKDDVYGWDFAGNDKQVFDGVNDDHGTHVAGTIGAVGGNAKGVAGVCWNVKFLNAKFLGTLGGTTANAIKAVDYFTNLKTRAVKPVNIVATNNSWGGGGYSQGLYDAIARANNAGILFIAAAGNDGKNNDATANYPSNYNVPNVIAVASITNTGGLSSFSNYGATQVDLGAPGSNIGSTVPARSGNNIVSSYAIYSGTSMATPHVSGAAALYAAYHPGATAAQIKSAILSSVTPTASLSGKTVTGGRLNVSTF